MKLGDEHMNASIDQVIGSHYMSSHWLATFITYALQLRESAMSAWMMIGMPKSLKYFTNKIVVKFKIRVYTIS